MILFTVLYIVFYLHSQILYISTNINDDSSVMSTTVPYQTKKYVIQEATIKYDDRVELKDFGTLPKNRLSTLNINI